MYTQEIVCPRCGKMTAVNVPDTGRATTPCQRAFCSAKIVVVVDEHGRVKSVYDDSSCVIATACLQSTGELEDCRELEVLRRFRDWYIREHPQGGLEISEYYRLAPALCEQISQTSNKTDIWYEILLEVRRTVNLIESGEREKAVAYYQNFFDGLKARFLPREHSCN